MSSDHIVPAHEQQMTHHYAMRYVEHGARPGDPHYKDFNHLKRQWMKDPEKWQCAIGKKIGDFSECSLDKPLEIHHAHIEWALLNEIDLNRLNHVYPGVGDPNTLGAWVESADNLIVYCLTPDSPVLMANGTKKPISDVRVGDGVVGGDGLPDYVTATVSKPYSGDTYKVGSTTLTSSHRVATTRGWQPIGEIADQIRMGGDEMLFLVCVEDQVDWSIVRPVPIDVMDALFLQQGTSEYLFGDQTMLHDQAIPVSNSGITLGCYGWSPFTDIPFGQLIQSKKPALVRAVLSDSVGDDFTFCTAHRASNRAVLNAPDPSLYGTTLIGTRNNLSNETVGDEEGGTTHDAGTLLTCNPTSIGRPVNVHNKKLALLNGVDVQTIHYEGTVCDISVERSNSFVSDGLVVHNCAFHHRGHAGAHVASASDYEGILFVKDLIQ